MNTCYMYVFQRDFFPNAYFPTPYSSNAFLENSFHFVNSKLPVGLPDRKHRFPPAHGTGLVGAFVVRVLHEPGRRA